VVVVGLVLGVRATAAAQRLRLVAIDVRVPAPPVPVNALGRTHLVYELRITNLGARDLALQELVVEGDGGATLLRWRGDSLKAALLPIGGNGPAADGRMIPGGRQTLAYLWVSAPAQPRSLEHRLLLTAADSLDQPARDSVAGPSVPVREVAAPVLRSPFRNGGLWLAANGPSNGSGHRRTAVPVDGVARVAQRFATDWIKLGPDGRIFHGDSTRNENWYGHGEPLVAVAAGRVVAVTDGIAENVPLSPTRAVPITMETVGGNHVILDLGGGFYGFYAHLQPGSVRVRVGDRVTAGQVIGLLGNSGNSDGPHLHFHVGDRPSPLGTEGLPFVFDAFGRLGRVEDILAPLPDAWRVRAGEPRRREIPLENDVVRFR
jgi:murein DD-endopeptidase MepM/ murein hydrolase activator NlpD